MKAITLQDLRANRILRLPAIVRLPVQLHDEPQFMAVEVRDETPERHLPAELEPAKVPAAEQLPQEFLRARGLVTHRAGAIQQHGIRR